jgi:hypothetical protein
VALVAVALQAWFRLFAGGRPLVREIAYYHGNDDGYWREGSNEDEVVFLNVPPGTGYLTVDGELPAARPLPARTRRSAAPGRERPRPGQQRGRRLMFAKVNLAVAALAMFAHAQQQGWKLFDEVANPGGANGGSSRADHQ